MFKNKCSVFIKILKSKKKFVKNYYMGENLRITDKINLLNEHVGIFYHVWARLTSKMSENCICALE